MTTSPKTYTIRDVYGATFDVPANRISVEGFPMGGGLYVLCSAYGPMCAVWAKSESDAWDDAADRDWLLGIKADEENKHTIGLGNYSEPHDMTDARSYRAHDVQPRDTALALEQAIGSVRGNIETLADVRLTFLVRGAGAK